MEERIIKDINNLLTQLFQKMHEAGYEWTDKKDLKKIEEEVNGEDYGIDSLWHAQTILEKTLGKVEGYQTDDGILEHKCAITAVKKLYEKKPTEWSEEDEKLLALSLNNLTELKDRFGEEYGRTGDCIEWLKSLKDRYWKVAPVKGAENIEYIRKDALLEWAKIKQTQCLENSTAHAYFQMFIDKINCM